jgi:hypothetical protein
VSERETLNRPNRASESPIANSARESAPKFVKKKKKREREKKLAGFWPEFGGVLPELLFEEYFGEKKIKSGHVRGT